MRKKELQPRMAMQNKKQHLQGMDATIERMNQKIAKLLGKRHGKLPLNAPQKTTNSAFVVLLLVVFLLLWVVTGFYYLDDDQSGIILSNGRITNVVKGMKVGFTLPYPFGDIVMIDSGISPLMTLNQDDIGVAHYTVLAKNLVPIMVDAKFSYQITAPKLLFLTTMLKDNSVQEMLRWQMQLQFRQYIMQNYADDIAADNLTIIASQLRDSANATLAAVGVKIVKLEISSFAYAPNSTIAAAIIDKSVMPARTTVASEVSQPIQPNAITSPSMAESQAVMNVQRPQIAAALMAQAYQYQEDHIAMAQVNIDKFNQLLPQYRLNPSGITEQMYFEMLAAIPQPKIDPYPLLNLSLSELLASDVKMQDSSSSDFNRGRFVDRSVNRARNLGGRD